jgi:GNAT superfamily N-acetyltransferase
MLGGVIRELHDEDIPAVAGLMRDVHRDFVNTEAGLRYNLAADLPASRRRFWVAEEGGEIVGRARAALETFSSVRDAGRISVSVRRDRRRGGLGARLYAPAEEHLVREGARRLIATADDPAGRPFLEARGFRRTHTDVISAVEPAAVDLQELPRLEAEKASEGLRLASLAAVRSRPRDVYELHAATVADVPSDVPYDDIGYDDWLRSEWSHPDITDEGSFVVLDGARPVSIAVLVVDPEGRLAMNSFTGTLPDYRGRGLARLVKVASIRWAAENGIERIVTANDETNAAMLAVNRRLGYRPVTEHHSYVKEL